MTFQAFTSSQVARLGASQMCCKETIVCVNVCLFRTRYSSFQPISNELYAITLSTSQGYGSTTGRRSVAMARRKTSKTTNPRRMRLSSNTSSSSSPETSKTTFPHYCRLSGLSSLLPTLRKARSSSWRRLSYAPVMPQMGFTTIQSLSMLQILR